MSADQLLRLLSFGRSSHRELIHQIHYLTVENRILRSKLPARVSLTKRERRRLLKFGIPVGESLKYIISIVHHDTFKKWASGKGAMAKKPKNKRGPGRPPTKKNLKKLVVKMARTPGWGYTRILDELRKLNIYSVSRTTVRAILKEHGIEPAPERSEPVWGAFLKQHAATLWSCDFFTKQVLTKSGLRRATMLAFMHVDSRKVLVTKAVFHPTGKWMSEVAECFAGTVEKEWGMERPTILVRDNDEKFGSGFDEELKRSGVASQPLPLRAPLMNAHIERWIKSLKVECLDHFVAVGTEHLDYLIGEYLEHYHTERPHQGIGNRTIVEPRHSISRGEIRCRSRLGGLLRHYYREAA